MHKRVVVALSGKYARKWALKNPVGTTGGNNALTLVFKLTIFVSKWVYTRKNGDFTNLLWTHQGSIYLIRTSFEKCRKLLFKYFKKYFQNFIVVQIRVLLRKLTHIQVKLYQVRTINRPIFKIKFKRNAKSVNFSKGKSQI